MLYPQREREREKGEREKNYLQTRRIKTKRKRKKTKTPLPTGKGTISIVSQHSFFSAGGDRMLLGNEILRRDIALTGRGKCCKPLKLRRPAGSLRTPEGAQNLLTRSFFLSPFPLELIFLRIGMRLKGGLLPIFPRIRILSFILSLSVVLYLPFFSFFFLLI